MTTGTATSIPTSFARRTPPDLPCGARPARPLAVHAASFARRVASKPGQALQASHPPPIGQSHPMSGTKLPLLRTSNAQPGQNSPHTKPRRAKPVQNSPSRQPRWTHPGQNSPNTPQNGDTKPFLACRENFFTPTAEASRAGRTLYRTQDHLRDKTLPTRNPGGPNRYKTLPAGGADGPTRDKTLPTRNPGSSVPHSGVTVWWSARLIWVRSPCDPSRKLSTSDSKRFGGTTMTAPHIITPAGLLGEALSQASPDLMRSLLQHVINALLSADADTVCGTQWNSLAARPGTRTRIIPSQE